MRFNELFWHMIDLFWNKMYVDFTWERDVHMCTKDLDHVEKTRRRVLNRISHPTETYIQRVDWFWHMMYVYSHGKETYICVHSVEKRRMSCSESHISPYRDVYSTSWLILAYAKIRHVTHIWQCVMAHVGQYMMTRIWINHVKKKSTVWLTASALLWKFPFKWVSHMYVT